MAGPPVSDWTAYDAARATLPLPTVSAQEREDVLAHGFEAGMIAIPTWFLHTARPFPKDRDACTLGNEQLQYGVDPSSVRTLYAGMSSSVGTPP